jgi:hypothetical protein
VLKERQRYYLFINPPGEIQGERNGFFKMPTTWPYSVCKSAQVKKKMPAGW